MTNKSPVKVGTGYTTPLHDKTPQTVKVDSRLIRLAENRAYLKNPNVRAFLDMIAWAEGGDYHAKFGYGWARGDWSFKDESTHPGPGSDGKTTAAGRYQITKANWQENGVKKMGLTDFSPETQDLIAVEGLRSSKSLDAVIDGDMVVALGSAARTWNSLPQGPGLPNRVKGQPYKRYEDLVAQFRKFGGKVTKE
ncbi:glycoside hydrolase family 24 protein [Pseudacidovorax intermedius]|uniref:glycoside hydrolase family 24 protein n=1 Tax=Pseudacidovorax intermedius TaxID=433924 RepID=UPI001FD52F16|nr:glycoside hydrolase family 104 protein [Pseudacidovorax intermedius]